MFAVHICAVDKLGRTYIAFTSVVGEDDKNGGSSEAGIIKYVLIEREDTSSGWWEQE